MGNLQVRFLEGWAPALAPGDPSLTGLCKGSPSSTRNPKTAAPVGERYRLLTQVDFQFARHLFTDLGATSSSVSMTTSAATKDRSVGSSSGTHFGEWRSGSLEPLASSAGFTAPMCKSTARTPARPYAEKSAEVIFAGISTALSGPKSRRSAATRRAVTSGSL